MADAEQDKKRALLRETIDEHWWDLLVNIRVLVWRFGLARDRTAIETLSREILQDTVVTALRRAENYDINRPTRPWLRGVIVNQIRRRLRDQGYKHRHISLAADTPQIRARSQGLEFAPLPEEEMFGLLGEQSRDPHVLGELLSLVGSSDREVLEYRYVEDLEGRELAARLGISEGAVRTRLCRTRERLRRAYHESNEPGLG
jgi:RNA polymerase sigma factor (sigma-70 family)